jgi:hypothetical protein
MANLGPQLAFLITVLIVCALWGRILWFFADHFRSFNSFVFFIMNFTRRGHREIKALLLGAIYYLFGLLAAFALWAAFAFGQQIGFGLSVADVPLIALGVVGQISLSNLLVSLYCELVPGTSARQFDELRSIPWIRGIMDLPPRLAPASAAFGGVVEELFFRGVVLQIMVQELRMPAFFAVAATGALFLFQQMLQVQTRFQAVLIGAGCIAISLVGGILIMCSASVVPALLCHASFVVFYLDPDKLTR